MPIEKLSRIDLNLLVCLKVLIEELNVTRAAQRLYLSQSAVSKSLAKLRTQFDDPLFTRHSYGLKPTPRALYLKPKLDVLIHHLEHISEPEVFDPQTSDYRFEIASVESVYPLIMPHFLEDIFRLAPNVTLSTHVWSDQTFKQIQSGQLDFGLTGKDIESSESQHTMITPDDICEMEIYRDTHMCMMRAGHHALTQEWNLETFLKLRHVQVRCDGSERWLLDYRLADMGRKRNIAITVPDFNSAASLCNHTDFIFTAPRHFVQLTAKQLGMEIRPLPLECPPMAYTLFWHRDRAKDPALHWLKNMIEDKTKPLR
ncbi:DNA-binding transcriptional regulator, LysR family [Vibrio xiamenensis]|uniref:DNA-binding transcriptional regulator, LysR family n=1 Tax=Vibrio xiamenensis TaxID=861298 RepID=A0A1G8D9F0_9VIBR|nr:LysR substrate-binding domain-containing protein [Vibrio xiamenensis]SDH54418.1 DNA-binding transcriptional regulator, LysR family [Vibrio xiamenensis]